MDDRSDEARSEEQPTRPLRLLDELRNVATNLLRYGGFERECNRVLALLDEVVDLKPTADHLVLRSIRRSLGTLQHARKMSQLDCHDRARFAVEIAAEQMRWLRNRLVVRGRPRE